MLKKLELTDHASCMSRAHPDEMTFVLLARDVAAPIAIRTWVKERIRLGKNKHGDAQIREALECADTMEQHDRLSATESNMRSLGKLAENLKAERDTALAEREDWQESALLWKERAETAEAERDGLLKKLVSATELLSEWCLTFNWVAWRTDTKHVPDEYVDELVSKTCGAEWDEVNELRLIKAEDLAEIGRKQFEAKRECDKLLAERDELRRQIAKLQAELEYVKKWAL